MQGSPAVGWHHRPVWQAVGGVLVLAVVVLSLLPPGAMPGPVLSHDKLGHLAAYAALMGWYVQLVPSRRWRFALGFAVLGAALEGVQALVGYRSAELTDLLADCIGVGLGWHVSAAWLPGALLRLDRALATLAG